jgi:hypothetical protein
LPVVCCPASCFMLHFSMTSSTLLLSCKILILLDTAVLQCITVVAI